MIEIIEINQKNNRKKIRLFFARFAYNNRNIIEKELNRMKETRTMEFKETVTNTFLKTVSAFSNYNGGMILFGVDDNGVAKGLPDEKQSMSGY